MKYLKNQQGIAFILELVLVAAVLTVIGFAIYAFMHTKRVPAIKTSQTPTPVASANPSVSPNQALNGIAGDYFYVRDLGVRFKLGPLLAKEGLTMGPISQNNDDPAYPYRFAGFSAKSIQTQSCQWGLGNLIRYEGVHAGNEEHHHGKTLYQFADFHILLDDAHSACHEPSQDELVTKLHTSFVGALKTLEPVK